MRKKLILFDWGNIVESHTTGYTCYDAWNELFFECGYNSKKNVFNDLEKYKLSCINDNNEFKNIYESIKKEFNLNKTYEEFIELYNKIFDKIDYYKDVAEYEVSLKDKCYIGILSNLTMFDKKRLDKQVNLAQYDYIFLSFEMGLRKPEIEIFNKVQSMLTFAPKDILLIDDRKDNIDIASKIGWETLEITGLELNKIKEKCEKFLNSV